MTFADYWRIVRKHWWLIAVMVIVSLSAGFLATTFMTPKYSSTTRVFVSTQNSENAADLLTGSNFTQQRVKSYSDIVSSPRVLAPVIKKLGLKVTSGELAKSIESNVPLNTVIVEITVTDLDPFQAARIANGVSNSLTQVVQVLERPQSGVSNPVKLSLVQPATVNKAPVSPKPLLNYGLSLLIGLIVGFGLAVLRETTDLRLRRFEEIEAITESHILGTIAYDPTTLKQPLIVHTSPKSSQAEAFRQLRTNIKFVEAAQGHKAIVVASAVPNEGKTTTSTNLAIALADTGARVLLIDGDFRKPEVHRYMGVDGSVGLSNLLIGQVKFEEAIQRWGAGRLDILPAGSIPPNPSELLGSTAMVKFMQWLDEYYDAIIIDAPPLLPVTDSIVMSKITGSLLMVVAVGKTTKLQLQAAYGHIRNSDAHLLGLVLNKIPVRGVDAKSYGYSSAYGYGYGYYGEKAGKSRPQDTEAKKLG